MPNEVADSINAINHHARQLRCIVDGDCFTDIQELDHHLQVVANYYSVIRQSVRNNPRDETLASVR